MVDHLDHVKALASNYRVWAASSEAEGKRSLAARQMQSAKDLDGVINELDEMRRITKPIPSSYGDLSDLPPELMKELAGVKVDELEQQLFTIIKSGAGEVQLDSVLIELFRRFKILQTRKFLQNKLWRMAQKGAIYSVPGRKGVYLAESPHGTTLSAARHPSAFDADLDDDVPF